VTPRSTLLLASLSCLATLAPAQRASFGKPDLIQANALQAHLEFIASDALGGRDTPSLGLEIACRYVASQLRLYGVEPAGENGTYFQTIPMSEGAVDPAKTTGNLSGTTMTYGTDFYASLPAGAASGGLVYVGRGMVSEAEKVDPYAGLDVRGKLVIALQGGRPRQGWTSASQAAAQHGAAGIVYIPSQATAQAWKSAVDRSARPQNRRGSASLPSLVLSPDAVGRLFAGEAATAAEVLAAGDDGPKPFALSAAKTASFQIASDGKATSAMNVVGIVRGSDPTLKAEMVAFGAHIDHVGTTTRDIPDKIYNGADDDGSGTVAILEIARAFALGPKPKRSLLFVWHCGEEKGLVGSAYFTDNPTVALDKVVAQLNIDMIGRSKKPGDTDPRNEVLTGPNEVFVVGSTKMSTDLQNTSERVNKSFLNMSFNYKYDDPKDTERIFYRSDHYNYARKGIPIIFYFSGLHEDYHQPSDEVEKIDFAKLAMVTQTVYATGWEIANAPTRPKVDKPLDGG